MKRYIKPDDLNKSSSELSQELRSKTLVAGVRYRPTTLANIVSFLESNDLGAPKSIGEALRFGLETLEQLIAAQGSVRMFADPTEAKEFLISRGLFQSGGGEYKARKAANFLSLEALRDVRREEEQEHVALDEVKGSKEFEEAMKHLQGNNAPKLSAFKDRESSSEEQDFSPESLRSAFSSRPTNIIEGDEG